MHPRQRKANILLIGMMLLAFAGNASIGYGQQTCGVVITDLSADQNSIIPDNGETANFTITTSATPPPGVLPQDFSYGVQVSFDVYDQYCDPPGWCQVVTSYGVAQDDGPFQGGHTLTLNWDGQVRESSCYYNADGTQSCFTDYVVKPGLYSIHAVAYSLSGGTDSCTFDDKRAEITVNECSDGASRPCYDGPAGTEGVGMCIGGTQACTTDADGVNMWDTACQGEVLPEAETCDGQDHNCNGVFDDGCECRNDDTLACYDGPAGTQGVGGCQGGTRTCINGHWDTVCQGEVLPQAEICDGADNNCNGLIDEGFECRIGQTRDCYAGPAGTAGVGICRAGTQACINCQWDTNCLGQVLPEQERCDGGDHNCNGLINEGCDRCDDDTGNATTSTWPFDSTPTWPF